MIQRVLAYVIILILLVFAISWLWAGGAAQIVRAVRNIPNPIDILWGNSTSTYQVILPWQAAVPQGPDISGLTESAGQYSDSEEQLSELQNQYSSLQTQAQNTSSDGTPSPYRGTVTLSAGTAAERDNEYIEIAARGSASVSLQGWSLRSMLSGARFYLPLAASPFILGTVNTVTPSVLDHEGNAIVYSGRSPIGTSFRENRCTGYLAQLQSFEPSLANACPNPSELMPMTADNMQRYGSDCVDYLRGLPQCTFPDNLPMSLSPACRIYIANTFSYNGCVNAYAGSTSFKRDTWRLYLNAAGELWSNDHDVIRLLDAEGRTVDSITY